MRRRAEVDVVGRRRDQQRIGGAQHRQRDHAQRRRRVEKDHVELVGDGGEPLAQPVEHEAAARAAAGRELVFGVVEAEVGRDQRDAGPVGGTQRIVQPRRAAMAEERVERVLVLVDIDIGVEPEDRGGRGLAVAVDDADPVALQRQILGEMDDQRRLADAALEVLYGEHRRRIVAARDAAGCRRPRACG